jgi:hypothetical protein
MRVIQCATLISCFASVASQIVILPPKPVIPTATVANPFFKPVNDAPYKLNLCESDCDKDSDCAPGLLCADAHKKELKAIGLDERNANCYTAGKAKDSEIKTKDYELCFDARILGSGGAGGGTLIHHDSAWYWQKGIRVRNLICLCSLLARLLIPNRPPLSYIRRNKIHVPRGM